MDKQEMRKVIGLFLRGNYSNKIIDIARIKDFLNIYFNAKAGNIDDIQMVSDKYFVLLTETLWDLVIERKISPSPYDVGTFFVHEDVEL